MEEYKNKKPCRFHGKNKLYHTILPWCITGIIVLAILTLVVMGIHDTYIDYEALDEGSFQDCLERFKDRWFYDEYNSVTRCNFEHFKKEEIVRIKQQRLILQIN